MLAGRAVYRHLYDVLYEQEGIYVWMEESGQSAPSALQGLGKGLAVILGVGCLCGLLYLLSRAYTKKGPGDPTASLFSGLGGSFRSTSTMPSSFDAWSRMRSVERARRASATRSWPRSATHWAGARWHHFCIYDVRTLDAM